jgi:hypothetical protein
MSQVMKLDNPALRAIHSAPATPPAGPDRIARTGMRRARSRSMIPPPDDIVNTCPR